MPFIRRHKADTINNIASLTKNTPPKQGQDKQRKRKNLWLTFVRKRRATSSSSSSRGSKQKNKKFRDGTALKMEDWRNLSPDEPPLPFVITKSTPTITAATTSSQYISNDTAFSETNRITSDAAPIFKDAGFLFDSKAFSPLHRDYQPTKTFDNYCGRELYVIEETPTEHDEEDIPATVAEKTLPMPIPIQSYHPRINIDHIKDNHDICDPSSSTTYNGLCLDDNLPEAHEQPDFDGDNELNEKQEVDNNDDSSDKQEVEVHDDNLKDKQEIGSINQNTNSNNSGGNGMVLVESDDDEEEEGRPYLHVPISYWPTKGRYYEPYFRPSLHYNEHSCKIRFAKMVTAAYQYYQHYHFQIYEQPKEMHILFNQRDYIRGITFIMYDDSREDFLDFGGSPQYIAPELSANPTFNPEKADIWALGISLYRMLIGRYPFLDNKGDYFYSHKELFRKMLKSDFDIPRDEISAEARDLLQRILAPVNIRASFDLIMFHPWLKPFIDFVAIARSSTANHIPQQISIKKRTVSGSIPSSFKKSYFHTAADTDIDVRRHRHKKQPKEPRTYPREDEHYFGFKRKKPLSSHSSFHILPSKTEAARKLKKLSSSVQKAFNFFVKGPYPPPSNVQDLVNEHSCQWHHRNEKKRRKTTAIS